jgi:hypothetical protein
MSINYEAPHFATSLFKPLTNSVAQEPEGSLPRSQQLATGLYPEPVESNPLPPPNSLRSILIPSSHLRLCFPSGLFHSGFHTKTLYHVVSSPMRARFPTHLIRFDFICLMSTNYEAPHCATSLFKLLRYNINSQRRYGSEHEHEIKSFRILDHCCTGP